MVRPYAAQKAILMLLRQALLLQRTVHLQYVKAGQKAPELQQVDPYSLLIFESGLYLVGYSHRAKALRKYAVERIKQVELTEETFALRTELLKKSVTQRPFGLVEDDPTLQVRIRFKEAVAHLLTERVWHPTQQVRPLGNGDVLLTMQAGGFKEILLWILSWGDLAQVLHPPELVELVSATLSAASRQYTTTHR